MALIYGIIFLLGLAIGSFLNVVVYRVLHGDSPFKGRSKCTSCGKKICWYDNVPLLSFLFLRGRCRHCRAKISWRYPVLEMMTGVLFVWWYSIGKFFFRLTQQPYKVLQPAFWLVLGLGLLGLTATDLFYGVLPDVFTVTLATLTFLYRFALTLTGVMQLVDFLLSIAAGVGASLFFFLLVVGTRGRGMGMGDVKLAFLLGLILGWPKVIVGLLAAFLTGAGGGIILILIGKRKFGQTIPFGPFMILGAAVALIWGGAMWEGYLSMLGI